MRTRKTLLALVVAAAANLSPDESRAATVTWLSAVNGNWNDATKWSTNPLPPQPGDDVVISVAGTYTVTLNVDANLNSLMLGGASGTQTLTNNGRTLTLASASTVAANGALTFDSGTLTGAGNVTVDGAFNWNGGTVSGGGAFTVNGPMTLGGTGTKTVNGRTLVSNDAATWMGNGSIGISNGGVLRNAATGTFTAQNDATMFSSGSPTGMFDNQGTLTKSLGNGNTTISVNVTSSGTTNAQSGTLLFNGDGTWTGPINVGPGLFRFGAGTHGLSGVMIGGNGRTEIASGTVNANGAVTVGATTTLAQSGGVLGGNGAVTLNGPFEWTGGSITGNGPFTANNTIMFGGTGTKTINGRTLVSNAAAAWMDSGSIGISNGGVLRNAATGTFTAQNDATMFSSGSPTGMFDNQGTLTKSLGNGNTTISVNVTSSGTTNAQSGTLLFNGDGTWTGPINVGPGLFRFGAGTHGLSGVMIGGSGRAEITSATVNGNGAVTVGAMTTLAMSGGTLGGNGALTLNGPFEWSGGSVTGNGAFTAGNTFLLHGSGTKTLNGRTLVSNGTATWMDTGAIGIANGGVLRNGATGTFDVRNDATMFSSGSPNGTFDNDGTFVKSQGAATSNLTVAVTNSGTFEIQSGTVADGFLGYVQTAGSTILNGGNFNALGAALNIQDGSLTGSGTVTGNVTSDGSVKPGLSPGGISITGNYTQSAGGSLDIEIGGLTAVTQFDQLDVNGTASLAGTLNVSLIDGFVPSQGNQFLVLDGTTTGNFGATNLPALPPGLEWQVTVGSVLLTVNGGGATGTPTNTPTASPSATRTPTATPSTTGTTAPSTPTRTPTATPTSTPTNTPTVTPTPTSTGTATDTPATPVTATPTATATPSPVDSATSTPLPTATATASSTSTLPPGATATSTATASGTATATPTATRTATATSSPTATPTNTATATPTPSATGTPTATPTPTRTVTPTGTEPTGVRIQGRVLISVALLGLVPARNQPGNVFTCENRNTCLDRPGKPLFPFVTNADGQFTFDVPIDIVRRRVLLILQVVVNGVRCRLLLTPRSVPGGAGGGAGIDEPSISVDPISEGATRLLETAGLQNYDDEGLDAVLAATREANADTDFTKVEGEEANDLAEQTAAADPAVQTTLEENVLPCIGDCDDNRAVTIDELVTGVSLVVRELPTAGNCEAIDSDSDGTAAVNELIAAVGNGLDGCP
jgi:phage baseplate assembly protein gpV